MKVGTKEWLVVWGQTAFFVLMGLSAAAFVIFCMASPSGNS